ncbi:LysR family transcriptional regulator [Actinomadura roseirufa]|uniref:LysR family transcriptional regulator n=1 Tax=Actinomadura roseirufa TaxID=2094049 RepID=UPI0010419136|nr:LysR family transcriptional regulator [Actinomadura roseirufa]
MDIRLLRGFLAVAEHRAFGRAARACSMTQPALTKQIQALEAQAGGRLFHRGRHGAALTALGAALLPEAHDLVRRADALALRMGRLARGEVGRLAVGFGMSTLELAPRAVAEYRRTHPDIDITLDDMSTRDQLERLASGDLDVGFVRLPVDARWGRLVLRTDRLALASSLGAGEREPENEPWTGAFVRLATAKGPGLAAQVERYREAAGIAGPVVQEAHDLQTVLALVAAGVGRALVPAGAGAVAPPQVALTPIDHPAARWRVGAVWDRDAAAPPVRAFLEVVRALAATPP